MYILNVIMCFKHDIIGLQIPYYLMMAFLLLQWLIPHISLALIYPNSSACRPTNEVIKTYPPLHVLPALVHNVG